MEAPRDELVVTRQRVAPLGVADAGDEVGGSDDVCRDERREEALGGGGVLGAGDELLDRRDPLVPDIEHEVALAGQDDKARVWDQRCRDLRDLEGRDGVVFADHDERRDMDARQDRADVDEPVHTLHLLTLGRRTHRTA